MPVGTTALCERIGRRKAFFGGVLSGVVEPIGAEVPLLL